MIIVTGGAGFIGSNLVRGLNARGRTDILVVDDLQDGSKFANLADCEIADYLDRDDFLDQLQWGETLPADIDVVFHQGACSTTTEWDGRYMMHNNYAYSKEVLKFCRERAIPLIYASSAAVYGASSEFREQRSLERPLNVYGYSKFLFDQWVRREALGGDSQVVGLRYFNVYGPREQHKGSMASVAWHLNQQLLNEGEVRLFAGCDGYADGEQLRDFIHVDDVVAVNLWMWEHPQVSGIFNVGTGRAQPFNDIARAVLDWHQRGKLTYIPFPEHLRGSYQSFTEADISALRAVGCQHQFVDVATGVGRYLDAINGAGVPSVTEA